MNPYRSGTTPAHRIALSNLRDADHNARRPIQIKTSRKAFPRGFYLFIDVLSLGHLTSRQDLLERVLVQHGYAQLLGLGKLGARLGAGD